MRNHKGWALLTLDDLCHREGLTAAGHTQEGLVLLSIIEALGERVDSPRLVTGGFEVGNNLEIRHKCWVCARFAPGVLPYAHTSNETLL